MESTPGEGAGWFADPSGEPQQRYWDGEQWTKETRPYPAPASDASGPLATAAATADTRGAPKPKSSGGRTLALVGLAVLLIAGGVGAVVFWRQSTDQAARDAAEQGAQIGGAPMSDVEALFCPDGPATDTGNSGVDCSGAGSASQVAPQPSLAPSSGQSQEPQVDYLTAIEEYCALVGSEPCIDDCKPYKDYEKKQPGSDIVMLTIADVRANSMVLFGAIQDSERSKVKPVWFTYWKATCR